jgi:hypothetical protein
MTGCDKTNRFLHPYCIFRSVQDVHLEGDEGGRMGARED